MDAPWARGRGIGRALVERSRWPRNSKNPKIVNLQVHRTNADAQKFYAKLGFVGTGSDALTFTLRLSTDGLKSK